MQTKHLSVLIHIRTNGEVLSWNMFKPSSKNKINDRCKAVPLLWVGFIICVWHAFLSGLSPPVKYFTDRSKAVLLLWIFYVLVLSCVCYVFVRVCLYVLCGHLLGKGWPLGSSLWCLLWVCHFPIGILGQVWYLIVSIPDLCTLTYFFFIAAFWSPAWKGLTSWLVWVYSSLVFLSLSHVMSWVRCGTWFYHMTSRLGVK